MFCQGISWEGESGRLLAIEDVLWKKRDRSGLVQGQQLAAYTAGRLRHAAAQTRVSVIWTILLALLSWLRVQLGAEVSRLLLSQNSSCFSLFGEKRGACSLDFSQSAGYKTFNQLYEQPRSAVRTDLRDQRRCIDELRVAFWVLLWLRSSSFVRLLLVCYSRLIGCRIASGAGGQTHSKFVLASCSIILFTVKTAKAISSCKISRKG